MLNQEIKYELRRMAALFASIVDDAAIECYLSLITLKYVSDKGIGMSQVSDFEKYRRVSDYFRDIKSSTYPTDDISFIIASLEQKTGKELHVLRMRFSENIANQFINNINLSILPGWNLSSLNGDEKKEELDNIVQAVNNLSALYYSRRTLSAASYALYRLVRNLLNVTVDDAFVDYVAGSGISTFAITEGVAREYRLYDIKKKASVMLLSILFDIDNLCYEERNLSSDKMDVAVADKIFMDPPLGLTYIDSDFQCDGIATRDLAGICLLRAVQALKKGGTAVITSTGPYLAGTQKQIQTVREYIINKHILKAVVSLPGSWYGSAVKTNLFILSKEENEEVVFVDATKYKIDTETEAYIDENGEDVTTSIADIIKNSLVTDISNVVSYNDVDIGNISPIAYLRPVESSNITVDEINAKLKVLYGEIDKKLKELSII